MILLHPYVFGGGAGVYARTAFVSSEGNDGTAALNSVARPWQTVEAALGVLSTTYPMQPVTVRLLDDPGDGSVQSVPFDLARAAAPLTIMGHDGPCALTCDLRLTHNDALLVLDAISLTELSWSEATATTVEDAGTVQGMNGATLGSCTAVGTPGTPGATGEIGPDDIGADGAHGVDGCPPTSGESGADASSEGGPGGHGMHGGCGRSVTFDAIAVETCTLSGGPGGDGGTGGVPGTASGGDGGNGGNADCGGAGCSGGDAGHGGSTVRRGGNGGNGGNGGHGGTATRMNGASVGSFASTGGSAGFGALGGNVSSEWGAGTGGIGGMPDGEAPWGIHGGDGITTAFMGDSGIDGTPGEDGELL